MRDRKVAVFGFFVIILMLIVSGCGTAIQRGYQLLDVQRKVIEALDTYTACVQSKGATKCDNEKAVLDSSIAAAEAIGHAGASPSTRAPER